MSVSEVLDQAISQIGHVNKGSISAKTLIFWLVWEIAYLCLYKRNILMLSQVLTWTDFSVGLCGHKLKHVRIWFFELCIFVICCLCQVPDSMSTSLPYLIKAIH